MHAFRSDLADAPGYFGRTRIASNYSAVTGACHVVKRSIFFTVGGFDAQAFPITYSDIDLCLRIMALGCRNVVTPVANLFHFEVSSRARDDAPQNITQFQAAQRSMVERHGAIIARDPCYSRHLTREHDDFSIGVDR